MNNAAVGRVTEGVADGGNVRAAPLTDRVALADLLGDEVAEHRELAGEVVIDADDFFLQGCGSGARAVEAVLPDVGAGKMPAAKSAVAFGSIMHDGMVLPGNGDPWTTPAGATPPGQFLKSTAGDTVVVEGTLIGGGTKVTAVGARKRNGLAVGDAALDQPAPFHVVEEEGPLAIAVVQLSESDRTTDVEAEYVEPEFRNRVGVPFKFVAGLKKLRASRASLRRNSHADACSVLEPDFRTMVMVPRRGEAVVRAVVRGQSAKLRDGVGGGSDAHAARTAAVVVFTTIQ